jgi:hypothetical protein
MEKFIDDESIQPKMSWRIRKTCKGILPEGIKSA